MDYLIHRLIDKENAGLLKNKLIGVKAEWEDGKRTAGKQAAKVKNNFQMKKDSQTSDNYSEKIISLLEADPLIKSYCLPKSFHGITFSRSLKDQGYGMHVDNAYMNSGRSDLSFTLFISDKIDYEGGELCIQSIQEDKEIKLEAGEIVIYPSTSLHAVNNVKSGERIVCVGWIQSYISSNEDRSIMFGLDAGARGVLAKYGQTKELDLIFQAYNNLLRRLGD